MEKVFYVQSHISSSGLNGVNEALAKGGKVKMIHAAGGGDGYNSSAYIVVEMPEDKRQK